MYLKVSIHPFFKFTIYHKGEDYDQNSSFSEFEIIKTLGEGAFGKVVLAIHRLTKDKVAIKFINPTAIGDK